MISDGWRALAPSLGEALAAGIRDAVLDGQIRSTDRLPAERRLAEQLGVSRGTVAAAFASLRAATGALMTAEARARVAALAASTGVTVIASEIMRDLDLRQPPAPLPRIPGAITVGSLSKSVWGGLRIGWIRGPAGLIRELQLNPLCAVCVPPPLEQFIACALLPDLDLLIRQRVSELRRQRDHLAAALGGSSAWKFTLPQGGLWLWLRLSATSGDELASRAAALGLALLPDSRFSLDGTCRGWLRFPYTAPPETLDKAASLLHQAASESAPAGPQSRRAGSRAPYSRPRAASAPSRSATPAAHARASLLSPPAYTRNAMRDRRLTNSKCIVIFIDDGRNYLTRCMAALELHFHVVYGPRTGRPGDPGPRRSC